MLKRYINRDLIVIDPPLKNKKELFKFMAEHLSHKGYVENRNDFLKALMRREEVANTEILPNVAIPHAGCSGVEQLFLFILISKAGIDYDNVALGPVNIVFLFGCDNQHNREYLRLLAKSARLLKNKEFNERIIAADSPGEILDILDEFDRETVEERPEEDYLMILTIYDNNKLHDVLTAMLEVGINNASVIKSTSMARRISYEIPVFAGLSMLSKRKSLETAVVLSTVHDKRIVSRLVSLLKELHIDLAQKGSGFLQLFRTNIIAGNVDEIV